jgi:hypothetical protein
MSAAADLSGNSSVNGASSEYEWSFFTREYTDNPLAINLTTGHTMITFDSPEMSKFLEVKKPYSVDFVEGKIYMLSKFSNFFHSIYEKGSQPNPKYLLKSLEFLASELDFQRAEAERNHHHK